MPHVLENRLIDTSTNSRRVGARRDADFACPSASSPPILFLLIISFAFPVFVASPAEERAEIDKAAAEVLNDPWKVLLGSRKAINSAVG